MIFFRSLFLYLNTIKYLKFIQIFYRIFNYIKITRISLKKYTNLRKTKKDWVETPLKKESYLGNLTFIFLRDAG